MADRDALTQRLEALRDQIRFHQQQYYVKDQPTISDAEYDALFNELQALEAAHPRAYHAGFAHSARRWRRGRGLCLSGARRPDAQSR